MLYDPYGREIKNLPTALPRDMIGTVRVRDQWSSYPTVKLTPDRLAGIFREADGGDILRQAELYEEMEEKDPEILSLMQTRKLAVQGLEFELLPASDDREDQAIAEAVNANLKDLDLDDMLLDLLDAIAKGFAAVEVRWDMQDGRIWAQGFEWIHQKRFSYNERSAAWYEPLPKLPRLLTEEEPIWGVDIPPFKILYHVYKARSGFVQRGGLLRTVAYYYLFKNYDIKDWVIFFEKFGQPLRIGKYSPGAGKDDIAVLKEAIQKLGTDAGAVMSDTTSIEFARIEGVSAHTFSYKEFADWVNASYAKAILGQTATSQPTPGALGNQEAQSDVRADLVQADAKALAKTLRSQLIWPMVGINFGWDKKLPTFRFIIDDPQDLAALSAAHKNLVDMGVPVPLSYMQKKYGIPAPEKGEEILKPAAPANPFQQNNPGFDSGVGAPGRSPFTIMQKKKVPVGSRLIEISD